MDTARLRLLAEGYFGLNNVFLVNVALSIAANLAIRAGVLDPFVMLGMLLALGTVVGFLAFPHNKKIGEGKGWAPSGAVIASVLMALNSAFCCGIIGYVVMQTIASGEMKRQGVRIGGFLARKQPVMDQIAAMEEQTPVAPFQV